MTLEEQQRAHWYGPSDRTPVYYVIYPLIQHWETPIVGTGWRPPPAPCLTGTVAESQGPVAAYNSGTWPWRLSVHDLQAKLATMGGTQCD